MTLRTAALLVPFSLLALAGCKNPAADAPKAEVAEAKPVAAEKAPTGVETVAIAPPQSSIGFFASKVTGSHDGGFKKFSGTVHLDPKALEASRIEVEIDMASVWTDSERLTGHLKTGDFFLVETHPTGRFVSTSIAPPAAGSEQHTITGNLTLRGVTKAVSFPATINVTNDMVRAKAEFSVPRKQFGIAYEGKPDDLVRDEVLIKLNVESPRVAK